jgi:CheY-like chemotaxis protein
MKRPGRILVIDDNIRWQKMLSTTLQRAGFHVTVASDPQTARERLQEHFYHIIVLDIRMEDNDPTNAQGFELLREWYDQGLTGASAIVMLSAYGTSEQMREAFRERGIADFLSKQNFVNTEFANQVQAIFDQDLDINLDLTIHWQHIANADEAVFNLKIDETRVKRGSSLQQVLASELDDLLCRLFSEAHSLLVRPLTPGRSGARVLLIQPFYTSGGAQPVIVKFGDAQQIDMEYHRFQKHIQPFIGGGQSTTIRNMRRSRRLGGIVYSVNVAESVITDTLDDIQFQIRQLEGIQTLEDLAAAYHRLENKTKAAELFVALGQVYYDIGDLEKARDAWRSSLAIVDQTRHPLLRQNIQTLLASLDEELRVERTFYDEVRTFFQSAGFELQRLGAEETYKCIPREQVWLEGMWKKHFTKPVGLFIAPDFALNREKISYIYELANSGTDMHPHILFVAIDKSPANSGWIQIGAMRADGIHVIPVDDTIVIRGTRSGNSATVLRNHLQKYLGKPQNLYDVRTPVADRLSFFGREALADELIESLYDGNAIALVGLRRIGKSSLLQYLSDQIDKPTAKIDLQAHRDLGQFCQDILEGWNRSLRSSDRKIDWVPPDLNTSNAPLPQFVRSTNSLLVELERQEYPEPHLCILLDEIDILFPARDEDIGHYLSITRTLKGLLQEKPGKITLLVAGVNPVFNQKSRLGTAEDQNPFYKFFVERYVTPLNVDDCIKMVTNIASQMSLSYDEQAASYASEVTGGHPFLARQLCSLAYQKIKAQSRDSFTVTDLKRANTFFIRNPDTQSHLDNDGLWGELTKTKLWGSELAEEHKRVLLQLAASNNPQSEREIRQAAPELLVCERAINNLEQRSVLARSDTDCLSIYFRLFRSWIRRYILERLDDEA